MKTVAKVVGAISSKSLTAHILNILTVCYSYDNYAYFGNHDNYYTVCMY